MKASTQLVILVFTLFLSCTLTAPHVEQGNALINRFVRIAHKSDDLKLLGSGGRFLEDIKEFSFYLYSFKKLNVDEARTILIENVEKLITMINSDINLFPYLHKHPFDYTNIRLFISFYKLNRLDKFVDLPYVSAVFLSHGIVDYSQFNSENCQLEDLHGESYQRAKGIVEHQRNLANIPSGIEWQ